MAGALAQWLREPIILSENRFQFLEPTLGSSQPPLTPVPEDLSLLRIVWAPANTWYTYTHSDTLVQNKNK